MTAADALRDPDKKQRASGGRARVRAAMQALGVEAPRPAEPPVLVSVKG